MTWGKLLAALSVAQQITYQEAAGLLALISLYNLKAKNGKTNG